MKDKNIVKRIMAIVAVVIIVALYILTLVCAIIGNGYFMQVFMAAIAATILLPCLIHIYMMMVNVKNGGRTMDEVYSYKKKDENDGN